MTGRLPLRPLSCAAGLVLAASGVGVLAATPAQAATDSVSSYVVDGRVEADGALGVHATLTLEGAPAQVQQRFATTLSTGRDGEYRFTVGDVKASVGGQAVTPSVTRDGGYQVVSVPVQGGQGPVELSYTVRGAALPLGGDTTEVNWRVLQGLSLPVKSFDATFKAPGVPTSLNCYAGPPAAPENCQYFAGATHDEPDPTFHDEGLGAGEVVGAVMRFPRATVAPNADVHRLWTLDHAFSTAPLPLGLAALTALLGGLLGWLLHRRSGRDALATAQPAVVAAFDPVGPGESRFVVRDQLRPGEIGTLADERVDPLDVAATVLDLAVRGHLLITELPRATEFAATEWQLTRRPSDDPLDAYERTLLDAVAPLGSQPVPLTEASGRLQAALPSVQSELYDEVVRQGWFSVRPDRTRSRWSRIGWIALVAAAVALVLLAAFTPFGLLGLVLVALAAGVGWLGQAMPARTARGAAELAGLGALRAQLATQPTDQLPRGHAHEELGRVLPYAVVLGGADRWLDGIARADDATRDDATELSWYHAPAGWRLADLPDSLRNFLRALQGSLVARQ